MDFENLTPNIKAGEDMARFCYNELFSLIYEKKMHSKSSYKYTYEREYWTQFPFELKDEYQVREIMHKEKWNDQNIHLEIGIEELCKKLKSDFITSLALELPKTSAGDND